LEGLEVSEVSFLELVKASNYLRFDSEYYSKDNQAVENQLKKLDCKEIKHIAVVADGDHSKFPDNQPQEIRYLQAKDIKNHFIEYYNPVYVGKEYFEKNKRSHIVEENVILSIMGSVGDIAIIPRGFLPCIANRAIAIIRNIKFVSPYYLFTFLCSKFGLQQIEKQKNGGVQERINLDLLGKIEIPILSIDFQQQIENTVKLAYSKREQSQTLYRQAEELLLETIGLKDFTPSQEKVNVKSFKESFLGTGRLDAEYYQPKYEEIINVVKNYKNGFANFESFIDSYSTGYPYKSETYIEENGIPLVRINNLTKEGLDLSNAIQIPKEDLNLSKKDIAKENDILISMSGTIGLSCIVREKNKIVINQRIMKITSKNYNPQVLSLLLNSIVGKYQLDRIGTGGVQTNISSSDIKNIVIPIIESEAQQQISALIQESFALRKESERLLIEAKEMVEREIEKCNNN